MNDKQVSNFCQAFANDSLVIIKLAKTQLSKIVQSDGFLGRLLVPLMKTIGLLRMKNIFTVLAKSVLIPLRLTAAVFTADGKIHNFFF